MTKKKKKKDYIPNKTFKNKGKAEIKNDCILLSCHTDIKSMTVVIIQIVYINSHKEDSPEWGV